VISVKQTKGFTLFELLVATAVFAVLSYLAYSGLMQVMDARAHVKQVETRLAELQLAMLHLGRDIAHAVKRPIRSEFGDPLVALSGGVLGEFQLELTRTGYRNPARAARSLLQRVAYRVEDNNLYRVTWPVLDRGQNSVPQRYVILSQVDNIEFRFLQQSGTWEVGWPMLDDPDGLKGFPRAVSVKLTLEDMGVIDRIFILPEV